MRISQHANTKATASAQKVIDKTLNDFHAAISDAISVYNAKAKVGGHPPIKNGRKVSSEELMTQICALGGNSLTTELAKFPAEKRLSPSAFVGARAKIPSEVFYDALRNFAERATTPHLYTAQSGAQRRLLAVDGTSVRISTNANTSNPTFVALKGSAKGGFNALRVVTLSDLLMQEYVAARIGPIRTLSEQGGLREIMDEVVFTTPTILVGDRNFSSYAIISDCIAKPNCDFVIRTKNGKGMFKSLQTLPQNCAFDTTVSFILTSSQSGASKAQGHIYVNTGAKRKKVNSPGTYVSSFRQPIPYIMKFRVISTLLPQSKGYEWLITSLDPDEFTTAEVVDIYRRRWNCEILYRLMKHTVGAEHLHALKQNSVYQEVYAALLVTSLVSRVINSIPSAKSLRRRKHPYKPNYKNALIHIKNYLRDPSGGAAGMLPAIQSCIIPIRPNRAMPRNMKARNFVPFVYRVP